MCDCQGYFVVAGYQGRLYIRYIGPHNTTIYADETLASFDSEMDANKFIDENYLWYEEEYYESQFNEGA